MADMAGGGEAMRGQETDHQEGWKKRLGRSTAANERIPTIMFDSFAIISLAGSGKERLLREGSTVRLATEDQKLSKAAEKYV